MSHYFPGGVEAMAAPTALQLSHTPRRFFRWSGAGGSITTPSTGQAVDGVASSTGDNGYLALPGLPVQVESGGSFSAGDDLQTDGQGRAVQHSTGEIVARALEGASGAGETVWAVFV